MSPEEKPAIDASRRPGAPARSPLRTKEPQLAGLSEASRRYAARQTSVPAGSRRDLRLVIAIASAIVVGAAITFSERFEYECGAVISVAGVDAAQRMEEVRTELAGFAMRHASSRRVATSAAWIIDVAEPNLLRLSSRTQDRRATAEEAKVIANGFLAEFAAAKQRGRATPSDAEQLLSKYAGELHQALAAVEDELTEGLADQPPRPPSDGRPVDPEAWNVLRDEFLRQRIELAQTTASMASLENQPEPTHGIVPVEERRSALRAHRALQQDLRELKVHLTELKLHLLQVWQHAGSPLERLSLAAADFSRLVSQRDLSRLRLDPSTALTMGATAAEYVEALERFQAAWTATFTSAKHLEVDALADDLLDVHQRARAMLNDFLYRASSRLTSIRSNIRLLDERSEDQASFHVLYSDLKRSFGVFQKAHHDLEFTAGMIDPRDNFRLETSLRSSRGLRRRSQQQIRIIDDQLQAKAVKRARLQRREALAGLERKTQEQRDSLDQTILTMVELQRTLNEDAILTEEYLRGQIEAEINKAKAAGTKTALSATAEQIETLAGKRLSSLGEVTLELVECGVLRGPINLRHRLRVGGLAAIITLLTVGAIQWMFTRRR